MFLPKVIDYANENIIISIFSALNLAGGYVAWKEQTKE